MVVPLSRMRWRVGRRPLISELCDGKVKGTCENAWLNRTPPSANASRWGVAASRRP